MADVKKTIGKSFLLWAIWALGSSVALFALLHEVSWYLLIFAWLGGGPLLLGAFLVLVLSGGLIGKRLFRGEGGIALGAFYCLTPFLVLALIDVTIHLADQYFISDNQRIEKEEKKSAEIISKQPLIHINGLYVESMSLRWVLHELLVDRQFSFIEGDVSNDKWLLDMSKDEQSIVKKSSGKKYYRIALGSSDSPDCISFKREEDNPARGIPVQPETCVTLVFDNALQSDTRLHANFDKLRFENIFLKRLFGEVYLEVVRIGETKPLIRIPFWPGSDVHAPEDFSPGNLGAFDWLMESLSPRTVILAKDGKPFVLGIIRASRTDEKHSSARATVRLSEEQLDNKKNANAESWDKAYRRAQLTGHPVVIDRNRILVPKSHAIFEIGGNFSDLYSTECCALLTDYQWDHPLQVQIVAELLNSEKRVTLAIKPESIPEEVAAHNAGANCYFRVTSARVTNSELIATGEFHCGTFQSALYDWVVSSNQLPNWIK